MAKKFNNTDEFRSWLVENVSPDAQQIVFSNPKVNDLLGKINGITDAERNNFSSMMNVRFDGRWHDLSTMNAKDQKDALKKSQSFIRSTYYDSLLSEKANEERKSINRGFFHQLGVAIQRSRFQASAAASGLLERGAGAIGLEGISEWAGENAALARVTQIHPEISKSESGEVSDWIADAVGGSGVYLAAGAVSAATGGGAIPMFLLAAGTEGEDAYRDAIQNGASEAEANVDGLVVGVINGAIEAVQMGRVFGARTGLKRTLAAIAKKKTLSKLSRAAMIASGVSKSLLFDAAINGVEETLQEGTTMGVPLWRGQKLPPWNKVGFRLLEAFGAGATVGGIFGFGGSASTIAQNPQLIQIAATGRGLPHLGNLDNFRHNLNRMDPVAASFLTTKHIAAMHQGAIEGAITRGELKLDEARDLGYFDDYPDLVPTLGIEINQKTGAMSIPAVQEEDIPQLPDVLKEPTAAISYVSRNQESIDDVVDKKLKQFKVLPSKKKPEEMTLDEFSLSLPKAVPALRIDGKVYKARKGETTHVQIHNRLPNNVKAKLQKTRDTEGEVTGILDSGFILPGNKFVQVTDNDALYQGARREVVERAHNKLISNALKSGKVTKKKARKILVDQQGRFTSKKKIATKVKKNLKIKLEEVATEKGLIVNNKRTEAYARIAKTMTGVDNPAYMTPKQLNQFTVALTRTTSENNSKLNAEILFARDLGIDDSLITSFDEVTVARRTLAISKDLYMAKIKKKAKKKGNKFRYINQFIPVRRALADFQKKTGITIFNLQHKIINLTEHANAFAERVFARGLAGIPVDAQLSYREEARLIKAIKKLSRSITPEENERMKKYVFSLEGRADIEEKGGLTDKEQGIVDSITAILQGPAGDARMENSLLFWMQGNPPSDAKGKDNKFTKEQIKEILSGARKAYKVDRLTEYVIELRKRGITFGIREVYYQSESGLEYIAGEYLKARAASAFEDGGYITDKPSVISGETKARKRRGKPREGGFISLALGSFQRTIVRNAAAKGLDDLYARLVSNPDVTLSQKDKDYIDDLHRSMLLMNEKSGIITDFFAWISGWWWRDRLTLFNFETASKMIGRNALQTLAQSGQAVNTRKFVVNLTRVTLATMKEGGLASINPQQAEDFRNNFGDTISQKLAIKTRHMHMNVDKHSVQRGWGDKTVNIIRDVLDATGAGYIGVDELARIAVWNTVYLTVSEAGTDFSDGKINLNKFNDLTQADTMMDDAQYDTVLRLLDAGKIREMSNFMAEMTTLDIHRSYKLTGRPGIERSKGARVVIGIYTYPQGYWDLMWRRGIVPLKEGITQGNFGRAKRGALSLAKGYTQAWLANKILQGVEISLAYGIRGIIYSFKSPAFSEVDDYVDKVRYLRFLFGEGRIDWEELIRATADLTLALLADFIPFPTKQSKKDFLKKLSLKERK